MRALWLILSVLIVLTIAVSKSCGNEIPSVGDGIDPETAELLDRYIKARRMSPFGFSGGLPYFTRQQKRNSELINSILGLPKVMNDAGRRK